MSHTKFHTTQVPPTVVIPQEQARVYARAPVGVTDRYGGYGITADEAYSPKDTQLLDALKRIVGQMHASGMHAERAAKPLSKSPVRLKRDLLTQPHLTTEAEYSALRRQLGTLNAAVGSVKTRAEESQV